MLPIKIGKRSRKQSDEGMPSSKQQKTMSRRNFWTPLQLNDDDDEDDNENNAGAAVKKKMSISPIKVLTDNREEIFKMIRDKGITNYLIKKISIGLKIICENMDSFDKVVKTLLEKNIQFFTHDRKDEKPFKAIIHGLEYKSEGDVKTELLRMGYKCTDVKQISKTFENYSDTIYIVYFERGTVRMHDLRKNIKSLFYTIIKWDYQRKIKNKPVQCRKCQMYGHGERGCNVKPKCASCAGRHKTSDCQSTNIIRCANCNNNHKATDPKCPNRNAYIEMRQKFVKINGRTNKITHTRPEYKHTSADFPPVGFSTSHSNGNSQQNFWLHRYNLNKTAHSPTSSNALFTEEEMMQLTTEMVFSLRSCKSRDDQFNVIAKLALKFLYNNK